MEGVAIYDLRPTRVLAFDLRDILKALDSDLVGSVWRCRNVECWQGPALEDAAAQSLQLTTDELKLRADPAVQTIWGDFLATRADESQPWLQISAIDSSYFEVFSTSSGVLMKIRSRFTDVRKADPAGCLLNESGGTETKLV